MQGQVSATQYGGVPYGGVGGALGGAPSGAGGGVNPNLGPNLGMGLGGQFAGARAGVGGGMSAWPSAPRPALPTGGGFGNVGAYNAQLAAQARPRPACFTGAFASYCPTEVRQLESLCVACGLSDKHQPCLCSACSAR